MNSMAVGAVLAVLLMFITTVNAAEGGVTFFRKEFTMTCPREGSWFTKPGETHSVEETEYYTLIYDGKTKGLHHCEYQEGTEKKKYYFYVKGKTCENCFELDATVVAVVIVVDVVGTVFVMLIIYRCTKKKSSGPTHTSKAPGRSAGRAPPVPSPDYEALNPHTRTQDPYSFVNRMG